jgi:SAM-dependent MidA family methyltransferase
MLPYSRPWFDAWVEYAYGAEGFWRHSRADEHFRTAASGTGLLAELVSGLVATRPEITRVVDIGAGDGRLLAQLADGCADGRLRDVTLSGVDLQPRLAGLSDRIHWAQDLWDVRYASWTSGEADAVLGPDGPVLIICAEWLDDLPCPVVAWQADGWRQVVIDESGTERVGPRLEGAQLDWADRWWPHGGRAEIGFNRDRAWASLIEVIIRSGGCALMIDYGHLAIARPVHGSLAAYREGRAVDPVPGPNLNLTAHVAVDAVRAAGEQQGAATVHCCLQSEVIPLLRSRSHPSDDQEPDQLSDLARRSQWAALTSEHVWGSHWWLLQERAKP